MNRNHEWECFIHDLKSSLPPQLEHSAQNAILRAEKRRHITYLLQIPLAGVFALVILFLVFANFRTGPFLRRFAGIEVAK